MADTLAAPGTLDIEPIYRTLFAAYPDALLLVDSAGQIAIANPAAERLFGYRASELAGLPVDALVPDSIRTRHAAYRETYDRDPKPRPMGTQMELVARRRDGTEVMVEIALSPLRDHGLPYVVAAVRGIAEYPRVRQALQRARYSEVLATMAQLAADAKDPDALLTQLPRAAADALQMDMAVVFLLEADRRAFRVAGGTGLLPGESIGTLIPNRPDTPPGFVLAQGAAVIVKDHDGERRYKVPAEYTAAGLVSAIAAPLSDRGQIFGVFTVRSRSRKQFDADEIHFVQSLASLLAATLQRARSEEALSHAQRLDSVGQLTGGIAHDFNNLLTIIHGNLQVLEEHPALGNDDGALQMVAAAARASRRGAELTGKLLAFARRQVLSPGRVDTAALLESLAGMLRRTIDQRIGITVGALPACPPCLADPGQLESALLNIAINARDAMPAGGAIAFSCRACGALPAEVAAELGVDAAAGDGYVAIDIADTGRGMSDEIRERAFEPFFTTKEVGRGTGLGLSTVYGFVKQSKGAVRLHSVSGAGTTVTLYLPRAPEAPERAAAGTRGAESVPRGLRVMLVEDDAQVRSVVRELLRSLGAQVSEFPSAEHALAGRRTAADHDLLLSDVALGAGARGTELARRVQQLNPRIAVLLMSGYSSDLIGGYPQDTATWELLRKPFERADLARAILKVLAARGGD
jgi:PAS domain S-box-containing protein